MPWENRDLPKFSKVSVNVSDKLGHSKLGECNGEVFLNSMMNELDHRDPVGDALFGGSEGKEISEMLVLEVGPVEGPEWRIDIEVAVERNGKAEVTEASGHVAKFL